jgi:O-6-methylguanine DNA methyltransferase
MQKNLPQKPNVQTKKQKPFTPTSVFLEWQGLHLKLTLADGVPTQLDFLKAKPRSIDDARLVKLWQKILHEALRKGGAKYVATLAGTEFQREVWGRIAKIPWGKTISYKELALSVGRPKAFRAVANACGANPLPLFIPCHRVLGTQDLGGFSGGLALKKLLLLSEAK